MQVDEIFVDKAEVGESLREYRPADSNSPFALGLEFPHRRLEVVAMDQRGVGANRFQRARHHPFGRSSPRRGEVALRLAPFGLVVVPVAHDLIEAAAIDASCLAPRLLDEVPE